jgi:hypothetical protein
MFPTTRSATAHDRRSAWPTRLILKWLGLRARFGFSEGLSHVYYLEDVKGLLLRADHADDAELTHWSSGVLDLLLVELASHTEAGAFGSTHGRSYQKDKLSALTEDTFTSAKMLFDDTTYPYQGVDNASLLATAQRYSPPAVAYEIARDPGVGVIRPEPPDRHARTGQRHPDRPYGLGYDDVMTWWALGGQFVADGAGQREHAQRSLWKTDNFSGPSRLRSSTPAPSPSCRTSRSRSPPNLTPGCSARSTPPPGEPPR